jgi:hypothetical protein
VAFQGVGKGFVEQDGAANEIETLVAVIGVSFN